MGRRRLGGEGGEGKGGAELGGTSSNNGLIDRLDVGGRVGEGGLHKKRSLSIQPVDEDTGIAYKKIL